MNGIGCDFCGEPMIAAWFCAHFGIVHPNGIYYDDGIWGVCRTCDALITAGGQAALLERSQRINSPEDHWFISGMHYLFFASKFGRKAGQCDYKAAAHHREKLVAGLNSCN